ncbi:MAG TPA: RNA-binding protein [Thermoplasmatales archaeon]|nr:RNA-binding protein [Thermoplasmatales archaeon]
MKKEVRDVVLPSQFLGDAKKFRAGLGTFVENGRIYAQTLGIRHIRDGVVSVSPLKGCYQPHAGDIVIGIVEEVGASMWLVDVNAIYPALLHVNEVPWHVEFGDTARYLNYGDVVLAKMLPSSDLDKLQITLKDRTLHKINGGTIIEMEPTKIPRLIGKKGSMIATLKKYTNCRIFVGKNGRIWVDGDPNAILKIEKAIRLIEREAHTYGLTDRINTLLRER